MPRTKKEVTNLDPAVPVIPKKRGRPRKNPLPDTSSPHSGGAPSGNPPSPVTAPVASPGAAEAPRNMPVVARQTAARQSSTQWPMPQVTWPSSGSGTTRTTSTFVRGPDGTNRLVSSETRNGQQFPQIPDATCILETLQLLSREPILDTLIRLRREPCDRPGCNSIDVKIVDEEGSRCDAHCLKCGYPWAKIPADAVQTIPLNMPPAKPLINVTVEINRTINTTHTYDSYTGQTITSSNW
jgi:hypothetical protein